MVPNETLSQAESWDGTEKTFEVVLSAPKDVAGNILNIQIAKVDLTTAQVTALVRGVDFTVAGSFVTLLATTEGDFSVVVTLDVPFTQLVDLVRNGVTDLAVVERMIDRVHYLAIQIAAGIQRSLQNPLVDPRPINPLPPADVRAEKFLAFDAEGDPVAIDMDFDPLTVEMKLWVEATYLAQPTSEATPDTVVLRDSEGGAKFTTVEATDVQINGSLVVDDLTVNGDLVAGEITTPEVNLPKGQALAVSQVAGLFVGTWTARSAAQANGWQSVTWSPELSLFCAVSSNGTNRVMTSPDGVTWTARSASEANQWTSVTWSPELGLFCAVSNSGTNRVMTSPDGINWTARAAAEANAWDSVTWSPELGLFCAVDVFGINQVMTSPDGIDWTPRAASEANNWRSVTWSPELGLFCAVSSSGVNRVMTSPDGIDWTPRAASEANDWWSITWSPELGLFCAVSFNGTNRVMTSPDGIDWTARSASGVSPSAVTWSPELGLFCAVAFDGVNRVMTSPDGITWTARSASEANVWNAVTWSQQRGIFCAVSSSGTNRVMHSRRLA